MLLTLTTTHAPATDLGYLLAKHPDRVQSFELPFGTATVFYPQADAARCSVSLMLDIDPVGLVRGRGESDGPLSQYVNDRPYSANSFMAVALARVFGTAMSGASKGRQDLADSEIPLIVEIPALRARGGEAAIRGCFEPLGYVVECVILPLDPRFPEWGESAYFALRLEAKRRLRDVLAHLYVLLPAIDGDKHYFIGDDEVEKLLDKAQGWLAGHPQREWIANRYLKRRKNLVRAALTRLLEEEEDETDEAEVVCDEAEEKIERPLSLNEQRMGAVLSVLRQSEVRQVLDLGCGEGRLINELLKDKQFERIVGVDVSQRVLEIASRRLHLERMPERQRARVELRQGALTYRDRALEGFDAACAIEVIEHLDPPRLPAFVRAVFGYARPRVVVVTTPNVEYNVRFESMQAGRLRHPDHRFEWTRAEFREWAGQVAAQHDYAVRYLPVGPEDETLGPPTQMAIFARNG